MAAAPRPIYAGNELIATHMPMAPDLREQLRLAMTRPGEQPPTDDEIITHVNHAVNILALARHEEDQAATMPDA